MHSILKAVPLIRESCQRNNTIALFRFQFGTPSFVTSQTDLNSFCAPSPDWRAGTVIRTCDVTAQALPQEVRQVAIQRR
jgi:hypothetical protein